MALTVGHLQAHGQSTFDEVRIVLQTNCTVGCHSGASPSAQLDLSGDAASVYAALINVSPLNPAAGAAGWKLVDPGYPERSFLFAKVAHDIDPMDHLTLAMGNPMPSGQPALPYRDIELIRQWILFGAGQNQVYLNTDILTDFYAGQGMARMEPLPAPDPSEGFQVHYGPFFLAAGTETEYFYKYATRMPETREVNRIEAQINEQGHHTAIYRYFPEADTNFLPGLRPVTNVLVAAGVYYTSDIIAQFPNSQNLVLPEATAFTWHADAVIDLNYHIRNYSMDSILACEFYANIYTQPQGTAQQEMISAPVYYGGDDPTALVIPPTGLDSTYVIEQFDLDSAYTWYIWSIMAHTHQLGEDFQVYRRTLDGEKGENIYNGHYDPTYSFNTGAYDWSHPPFRRFDEFLEVNFNEGLIHEAVFNNPGPETVYFGLHTTDEMYVTYVQYIAQPTHLSISEQAHRPAPALSVHPNPATGPVSVSMRADAAQQATLSVWDQLGRLLHQRPVQLQAGHNTLPLGMGTESLPAGIYAVSVSTPAQQFTAKLLVR
ncbi:MAG: T9SS type A sorting domain-containing protein [Flavobacteriales bacterium]|nr:T9SS type A sorting domain-containing protein [Flavobacteriales bacterium]